MNLKSPAPIQSRLERLRSKGYIDWTVGKARTLRILRPEPQGIPILGSIAAGGLVEPFTDTQERLDLSDLQHSNYYSLQVTGDSMIEALIAEGDHIVLRPPTENEEIKNGTIVAARVDGEGATLKYFHKDGNKVSLKAANHKYKPIEVAADKVEVQGVLVGIWRGA
jgi:repressor LexA